MKKVLFASSSDHFAYGIYALQNLPHEKIILDVVDYNTVIEKLQKKDYDTVLFAHDIRGGEMFEEVLKKTKENEQKLCRLSYATDLSGDKGYFSIQMIQSNEFIDNIKTIVLER